MRLIGCFIVCGDHAHHIAPLQLAGEHSREAGHGDGYCHFVAVKNLQRRVCVPGIRRKHLGQKIGPWVQVGGGVFANHILGLPNRIGLDAEFADFHRGYIRFGDHAASCNVFVDLYHGDFFRSNAGDKGYPCENEKGRQREAGDC